MPYLLDTNIIIAYIRLNLLYQAIENQYHLLTGSPPYILGVTQLISKGLPFAEVLPLKISSTA